ncbi:MAG: hypothetical protein WKG07_45750 [Hymenobacter sp.]
MNAAGTDFDFNTIGQTSGYQTANIMPHLPRTAFAANFGGAGGGEIQRTTDGGQRLA